MAGFTYATLTTAIQNYTEVGTGVLSSTITDQFIDNSELRIQREIPLDADRKEMLGNLTASKDNVYAPAGTLFVRGLQVYTSTSVATGTVSEIEYPSKLFSSILVDCTSIGIWIHTGPGLPDLAIWQAFSNS